MERRSLVVFIERRKLLGKSRKHFTTALHSLFMRKSKLSMKITVRGTKRRRSKRELIKEEVSESKYCFVVAISYV